MESPTACKGTFTQAGNQEAVNLKGSPASTSVQTTQRLE